MKKILQNLVHACLGVLTMAACQQEFEYEFAENGPEMSVISCDENALMGGKIHISVELSDPDFALSTLKATLYFDLDPVSEANVRTKEEGVYNLEVEVPYYSEIPEGIAELVIVSQNVGQGETSETVPVTVSRPHFSDIALVSGNDRYEMESPESGNSHIYSTSGPFRANDFEGFIEALIPGTEDVLRFGMDDGQILAGGQKAINFHIPGGAPAIVFDAYSLTTAYSVNVQLNGTNVTVNSAGNYEAVLNLKQNSDFIVSGYDELGGWTIDSDYIDGENGRYTFLPVDGLYKVTMEPENKFFRFERMQNETALATLNDDKTGAVWLIGAETVGKPTTAQGASWNPEAGGLCMAQIEPGKFQITLEAGKQLSVDNVDFKFFYQKTWGGEFKSANITTGSSLFTIGAAGDGNIGLAAFKTLETGRKYTFIVDLADAELSNGIWNGAVMSVEIDGVPEAETEPDEPDGTVSVSGADYGYTWSGPLNHGQTLMFSGIENLASYYLDPDYMSETGEFNAMSGNYRIDFYSEGKYVRFTRLDAAGNSNATLADGALWLRGWGMAQHRMSDGQLFGWDSGDFHGEFYCMAEIREDVYQFTGIAVGEHEQTFGGRLRYDYIDIKYFYESGYNQGEASAEQMTISGNAANFLKMTDGSNINLSGSLEQGKTYRLTIDLSEGSYDGGKFTGTEKITFEKLN